MEPCGELNPSPDCMKEGHCLKRSTREFVAETGHDIGQFFVTRRLRDQSSVRRMAPWKYGAPEGSKTLVNFGEF